MKIGGKTWDFTPVENPRQIKEVGENP